ncbi:hypothetical protein EV217_5106 [Phyllobacterium myrsinacearum]|uniref:hypothetical protein n=1 Tax=Phyllobacterium myrsinacearum TaxID=28101 RepID=UPI00102A94CC|nr:hypothetical protein [Phyllobacterium myrsinacearum]RZS76875.1 hypothetical protein EV217_5106 [Phyllobacterium myrsinacearum]
MATTVRRNENEWKADVLDRLDAFWGREDEYPVFCVAMVQVFDDIKAVQHLVQGEAGTVFDWREEDCWQGMEDDLAAWQAVIAADFNEDRTLLDLLFPTQATFASDERFSGLSLMARMQKVEEVYELDAHERRAVGKAREAFSFFAAFRVDFWVHLREAGIAGTYLTDDTNALIEVQRTLWKDVKRLDLEKVMEVRRKVDDAVKNLAEMSGIEVARIDAALQGYFNGWSKFFAMEAKGKMRAD